MPEPGISEEGDEQEKDILKHEQGEEKTWQYDVIKTHCSLQVAS